MITIVLLALVFTAKVSSTDHVVKDEKTIQKEVKKVSAEVKAFYMGINELLMKFDCDRGVPYCKVWQAGILIADFGTGELKKECDNPGSVLCKEAMEILQKENKMTHSQILKDLTEKTKKLFDTVDTKSKQDDMVKYTDQIYRAATEYVCYKVPSQCNAVR
jgi:hypothetical protein